MILYRLKEEAQPYFKDKLQTEIRDINFWSQIGAKEEALEIVEEAYIKYGHESESGGSTHTCGWSNPDNNTDGGTRLNFTVIFPSIKYKEHNEFTKGKMVRQLMDSFQSQANYHMNQFLEEKN